MSRSITDDEYRHAIFPDKPFGSLRDEREAEQWNQIYFLFSLATLRAQAYEDGMACFVVAAEERWMRSGKTAEKIWGLTLGALQKEYCRYCHMEAYHHEQMRSALKMRNSLAHNFYRKRKGLLGTAEGREQVVQELHAAIHLFRQERDEMYWDISLLNGQPPL